MIRKLLLLLFLLISITCPKTLIIEACQKICSIYKIEDAVSWKWITSEPDGTRFLRVMDNKGNYLDINLGNYDVKFK